MTTECIFPQAQSQFDNMPEDRPLVFISYSWDSEAHKKWVYKFSNDLRDKGVYTFLDQYCRGGEDLITFMTEGLKKANKVLIIGTSTYKKKTEKKSGGVKFEDQVITIELYNYMDSSKFIPVLREGSFNDSFSGLIGLRNGFDMRDDAKYETELEKLVADLWDNPMNAAPKLGPKPNFSLFSQDSQPVMASMPEDFVTTVKKYLSDNSKQIEFTELIEKERENALKIILDHADYNKQITDEIFKFYLSEHQKAIAKLMSVVLPIVRFGNIEQQKLLVDAMVRLCYKPFKNGEKSVVDTKYLHILASSFLYHAVGVAAVKYDRFELIKVMMEKKVKAPNIYSPNDTISLAFLAGCNNWDNNSLNNYFHARWRFPYSQMIMDGIKHCYDNIFYDDDDFKNCYYIWEHMTSLLCHFYKCNPSVVGDFFMVGEFVIKRHAVIRKIEDSYTDFFNQSKIQRNEWLPIKCGLFGGRYDVFEKELNDFESFLSSLNIQY